MTIKAQAYLLDGDTGNLVAFVECDYLKSGTRVGYLPKWANIETRKVGFISRKPQQIETMAQCIRFARPRLRETHVFDVDHILPEEWREGYEAYRAKREAQQEETQQAINTDDDDDDGVN